MDIIGVVCEYNPFHIGHEYHLMKSREKVGENTPVVCVMSGDFVQRGEPAVFSKYSRAEAACRCGADLVVELPLPWSVSSAEAFARGSVGLLYSLGANYLSFGSETGLVEPLSELADALLLPDMSKRIKQELDNDSSLSFAVAREKALMSAVGDISGLIEKPNNILAVEYIKAVRELGYDMKFLTVKRFGSGHDECGNAGPKSASELRRMLFENADVSEHIPASAFDVYRRELDAARGAVNTGSLEQAIVSRLRMLSQSDFIELPDSGGGIGQRMYTAVQEEPALSDIETSAKSKRYALSRIRRMCMCAALNVKAGMNEGIPPYARVLAANSRGRVVLRYAQELGRVPIVTKPATVRELSETCESIFTVTAKAHDLYVLAFKEASDRRGGADWRTGPTII